MGRANCSSCHASIEGLRSFHPGTSLRDFYPHPKRGRSLGLTLAKLLGALPTPHLSCLGATGTHRPGGETGGCGCRALDRGHHVGRARVPLSQRQTGTTTQSPSQAISERLYTASDSSPLENNAKL